MCNQVDPTNSRWVFNTFQTGGQRWFDQLTGRATAIEPGALRTNRPCTTTDHPHRPLAAQPGDRLHRCAGARPVARSRRRLAGDQPRSDDRQSVEVRPQLGLRAVLHDHVHLRVPAVARRDLGGHRRWQGAADAGSGAAWTDLTAALAAAGGSEDRYVSRVFAPPHEPGTRAAYQFRALGNLHMFGDGFIEVPNEPDALVINYFVREKSESGRT